MNLKKAMTSLFRKHESQLTCAWKQVLDDKDPTDWMLIGYDGQSDWLKLVATGEYGLEELAVEFNPGQVMYAFCSVLHPKTKLKAFLIINWVGEGAPVYRKATSASHQFEVNNFFRHSSLTIQARVEEDVEADVILDRLAKVATTEYDFSYKDRSEDEQITPVGTCYERVKADREINLKEKTRFWSQMQQEEAQRQQEERKRLQRELQEVEDERTERERKAAVVREELIQHKEREVERRRQAELAAEKKRQQQQRSNKVDEEQSANQSIVRQTNKRKIEVPIQERESFWAKQEEEEQRQRRTEEQRRKDEQRQKLESELQSRENSAKTLKQSFDGWNRNVTTVKKTDAFAEIDESRRKVMATSRQEDKENVESIEQQTMVDGLKNEIYQNGTDESKEYSNGAMFNGNGVTQSMKKADEKGDEENGDEENGDEENGDEENGEEENGDEKNEDEGESDLVMNKTFEMSPHLSTDLSHVWQQPTDDVEDDDSPDDQGELYAEELIQPRRSCLEVIAEEEEGEEDNLKALLSGKGKCAKAIYDYQAHDDQEISFDPDDIITHIKQTFETWWEGLGPDNKYGLFPANYVELLN